MSKIIRLNSYIPESFIEIKNNNSRITIVTNDIVDNCNVYINSAKITFSQNDKNSKIIENVGAGHVRISIDYTYKHNITFNIKIYETGKEELIEEYTCIYTPILLNIDNINSNFINDIQSSYMMIRTNPKLSGNIKLVIDSNNDLYIDTFNINNELSQSQYRKRSVGINSYYSNDIRNIFKSISSNSLYAIPDGGDNIKMHFNNQFIDVYNYGVKLNNNREYTENFSFLAPLWINNNLPDYFVIFKVEDFKNNDNIDPTNRLNYCIQNGKLIKSFSLKRNSKLGKYLRNHQSEIDNYMTSACISNNKNTCNYWYGISIDSGIISYAYEDAYEIDNISSQVYYDNYITNGYERNRFINPYLFNLEFMFDDKDSLNLSINQYVGFYIYNHEYDYIYKIEEKIYDKDYNIINLNNEYYNNDDIKNRIFNISIDDMNIDNVYRFTNSNDVNDILSKFITITDKNILHCPINTSSKIENHPQFITIKINTPIKIGEHIRIIDKSSILDNKQVDYIYEVIGASKYNDDISITYSNDNKIKHIYGTFSGCDEYDDNNKHDIIKQQIIEIVNLFNTMNDISFKISTYSENSISFMSYDAVNNLTFERITHEIIYDESDKILESIDTDKDITYFNDFIIPGSLINLNTINDNLLYSPLHFEIWNNRKVYIVNFTNYNNSDIGNNNINTGNTFSYSIDKKYIKDKLNKECLTPSANGNTYEKLNNFSITYLTFNDSIINENEYNDNPKNIIISPYNNNEYIVQTTNKALLYNNIINIYSIKPVYFNIAGISPIKDFSFNVLDSNNDKIKLLNTTTEYTNMFSDENILTLKCSKGEQIKLNPSLFYKVKRGQFNQPNNLNDKKYVEGDIIPQNIEYVTGVKKLNELLICYNNYNNYFSILPLVGKKYSFESLDDYTSSFNNNKSYIPLITPTLCKWHINGTDIFGNNIKKLCKNSINNHIDTFYKDIDLLGYSSFKYLNDNPLYIYNNLNDIVDDDLLINKIINKELPILSIFSNDNYKIKKFSTLFFNKYNNSLETIFCGKKISLKFSNLNNIYKYNNYMFSIINSPHSHKSKNEVNIIISNEERMCIIINYKNSGMGLETYKNTYIIDNIYDSSNATTPIMECPFSILNSDILLSDIINEDDLYIPISNNKISADSVKLFISAQSDYNKTYKSPSYTYEIDKISINKNDYIDASGATIIKSKDNLINTTKDVNNNIKIEKTYNDVYEYVLGSEIILYNESPINAISKSHNKLYIIDESVVYDDTVNIKISNNADRVSHFINPDFTDIVTFNNMETSIINNIIKRTLISSNTNIKKVNSIKQLWINKQYDDIYENRNGINIDCIFDYNLTLTPWDNTLRIYNNNGYTTVKGYKSFKNDKMFFGSVAPSLNNEYIELCKYGNNVTYKIDDNVYDVESNISKKYIVKINISNALLDYIKNDTNFININMLSYENFNIDEYIKNMLSYYYMINNKNTLKLFRCYTDKETALKNKFIDFDNNKEYEDADNISFDITLEDNQYYLNFELPFNNYQYSIKYKIIK